MEQMVACLKCPEYNEKGYVVMAFGDFFFFHSNKKLFLARFYLFTLFSSLTIHILLVAPQQKAKSTAEFLNGEKRRLPLSAAPQ